MLNYLRQRDIKFSGAKQESFVFWGSVIALIIIGMLVAVLYWPIVGMRKDFYNNLWAPVYLLVHGRSPYVTAALDPALPAIWFPMAIGVFFPLGYFSEEWATSLWFLFNVALLLGVIYLSTRSTKSIYVTSLAAFFTYLFPSVLNHFALGQFSITSVMCILLASFFADKQYDWPAAFFLTLALSKPQLGILAVFGFGFFYFQKRGSIGLLRFGIQCLFVAVLMCLPLFIAYPAWIQDCIESISSNSNWFQPSLFSVLTVAFGSIGYLIWGVIAIAVFIFYYKISKIFTLRITIIWGLALTTLISPYLWSWDFVLLLPLWIHTFSFVNWPRKAILIISHLILWWAVSFLQQSGNAVNQILWWIPLWILFPIVLVTNWRSDTSP